MKRFTFLWFIENYSYCWHKTGEKLVSPIFSVEAIQSTSWSLILYPRGEQDPNFMSLCLQRYRDWNGPESIALTLEELSILDAKGKVLDFDRLEEDEFDFAKDDCEFFDFSLRLGNDLGKKDEVLISDVLGVRCTMSVGEGNLEKDDFCYARTRLGLDKISFINIIENVSKLQPNQKKLFQVKSISKDGFKFFGNVFVKLEPDLENKIMIEISPKKDIASLITCQINLLSSDGKELEIGKMDTICINGIDTFSFPVNLDKILLEKKLEYIPNDNLTLRCECTMSPCIEYQRIEETHYDLHLSPSFKVKLYYSIFSSFQKETKSVLQDFKNLYENQIFSDIELKTISKSFPAHKSVLCARSPVFRAMLTTNMKEKMMDRIQVDDLDDGTIDQFLLFLYTDILEEIQWESAMKLYYAADKYQVKTLKEICASFLITKLDIYNMRDLLVLADRHQDFHLRTAVEKFICKRDKKIFCTNEWESFMNTNAELAMKTMHFYLKNSDDY